MRKLRTLGFEGPCFGTRHEFMALKGHRLAIPSNAEYSVPQLRMMLNEVESITGRKISAEEWESLA